MVLCDFLLRFYLGNSGAEQELFDKRILLAPGLWEPGLWEPGLWEPFGVGLRRVGVIKTFRPSTSWSGSHRAATANGRRGTSFLTSSSSPTISE